MLWGLLRVSLPVSSLAQEPGGSTKKPSNAQCKCNHWKCIVCTLSLSLLEKFMFSFSFLTLHDDGFRPLAWAIFRLSGDVNKLWGTAAHWQQLLEGNNQWGSFVCIVGSPLRQGSKCPGGLGKSWNGQAVTPWLLASHKPTLTPSINPAQKNRGCYHPPSAVYWE